MVRVPELDCQLPAGMRAYETADELILICARCDDQSVNPVRYAGLQTVLADARSHGKTWGARLRGIRSVD